MQGKHLLTREEGNLAGGELVDNGLSIQWAQDPDGRTGCDVLTLINAAIERATWLQGTKYRRDELEAATIKLEEARGYLTRIQQERTHRGVLGTNQP
jgi:hypothetical protein